MSKFEYAKLADAVAAEIARSRIGARCATVRHEQRVVDECGVADDVRGAGWRVPGRVHHEAVIPPIVYISPSLNNRSNWLPSR